MISLRGRLAEHQAFQQRVAGQPVGAVQAGVGGFADRIEAGQVGPAVQVGDDAAAGIVRGRHDRDRLLGDVDAEFQAALVDVGEMLLQELRGLVGDVEVDAVEAAFFISKSIARATMSRGASSARSSCSGMKRATPSGSFSTPPSPRTASLIRKDLACGW